MERHYLNSVVISTQDLQGSRQNLNYSKKKLSSIKLLIQAIKNQDNSFYFNGFWRIACIQLENIFFENLKFNRKIITHF